MVSWCIMLMYISRYRRHRLEMCTLFLCLRRNGILLSFQSCSLNSCWQGQIPEDVSTKALSLKKHLSASKHQLILLLTKYFASLIHMNATICLMRTPLESKPAGKTSLQNTIACNNYSRCMLLCTYLHYCTCHHPTLSASRHSLAKVVLVGHTSSRCV